MNPSLLKEFKSPGAAFRGKPFWAWNGKLEPGELRRQIRVMNRMGLGGFFMHSRVGLATPYLSQEWFDCVKACVEEARKLGMEAWLYDEDRWPSGAAGGLVTSNPKHAMRGLYMREFGKAGDFKWSDDTLAAFAARVQGAGAAGVRALSRGEAPRLASGESILAFTVEVDPPSSWYNGFTYLDTMSAEAVREFIKVTYEAYRKRFGEDFGRLIPGIFTDEPNYGAFAMNGPDFLRAPWTPRLPEVFRQRYGYNLLDHLVEIFLDVDGRAVSSARYDFHDAITHLFVEAFARQIGEWCQKNGIAFTGHVLSEETPISQTWRCGSAMRFYEYMQLPGMDILTEHRREYDTAKQVSSVARQFGRKWRLTETYGCTGWDFPFAGHKAIGDWQVALGINLRCQHLAWYTMLAEAKRDYPAGIFYHSPWWQSYAHVEDYFARVHAAMTRGREVRDLLVIHPIESAWLLCKKNGFDAAEAVQLNEAIEDLRDSLLSRNLDFDYGDEDILARHGKVSKSGGVPRLIVGRASYRAVVVPPLITIRKSTLRLLQTFKAVGGLVVFAGTPPRYVDARPSIAASDTARVCVSAPAKGKALADAVEAAGRRVSILDEGGDEIGPALHLLREDDEAFYLFVCNTGFDFARGKRAPGADVPLRERDAAFPGARVLVHTPCKGAPVELDPQTGETYAAAAEKTPQGWLIQAPLPPLASRVFVIPKEAGAQKLPSRPVFSRSHAEEVDPEEWDISLSECNNLVLDRPASRIAGAKPRGPEEILRVDCAVREALGIPPRGGRMVQPWARKPNPNPKSIPVSLAYTFDVKTPPTGDLAIAIERPELYRIAVNGVALDLDAQSGWWTDISLRRVPLDPAILRLGANTVTLDCDYREDHPGLEIIYLLGSFGVSVKDTETTLIAQPRTLKIGDWARQGLPFYSGSVTYLRTIRRKLSRKERLFIEIPDYRGVAVRVLVNGRDAGIVGWPPNELDITDLLEDGVGALAIEVLGHRRNSHGPLHHAEKWPKWTGPGQYVTTKQEWVDSYQLVPCGLMKPPRLVERS